MWVYLKGLQPVADEAEDRELRRGADEGLGQIGVPAAVQTEKAALPPDVSEGVDGAGVVVLVAHRDALG